MKVCKKCRVEKPYSEFHISQQGVKGPIYKSQCKVCVRKKQVEKYHTLTEEQKKQRREKSNCYNTEYRQQYNLRTRFGLTTEDFSAIIVEQNFMCKICGVGFEEKVKPQVDHCHETGKVRGLLCRNCNTSLGLLKENPETLRSMIDYLNDYL